MKPNRSYRPPAVAGPVPPRVPGEASAASRPVPDPRDLERQRFDGAMVLEDLEAFVDDPEATHRVLARYAAVRLVVRAASSRLVGGRLRSEREVAATYVAAAARGPLEEDPLAALVHRASPAPEPGLCDALTAAGDEAAGRSAVRGAFACYLTGHRLARTNDWPREGARAARAAARLSRTLDAGTSARRWMRRADTLARRAARDEAADDPAGP